MGGEGGVEIHAGGGALSPVPQWPFPSCTPPARGWGSVPDGPGEWVCSGSEGSWRFSSAQCGRLLLSPDLSTGNVGAAPHRAGAAHSSLLLRLV